MSIESDIAYAKAYLRGVIQATVDKQTVVEDCHTAIAELSALAKLSIDCDCDGPAQVCKSCKHYDIEKNRCHGTILSNNRVLPANETPPQGTTIATMLTDPWFSCYYWQAKIGEEE